MNLVHDLPTGDLSQNLVNTIIEIPERSSLKIEYNIKSAIFEIDRVEPDIFAKPANYGFIPQTLDDDGDPLDTLIVCHEPIPTGVKLTGKILGVLNFEDGGDLDHKIVLVPADDRNNGDMYKTLDDLGARWKQKIEFHFTHYKDLKKPGTTKILGWGGVEAAKQIISECVSRYQKKFSKNP
jgi:inorganic pyrophosphatase